MCALVMSTSAWPAPAPPPPSVWKQNACCASPVIVPSAKRSNSAQPQKPPSSSPQKDGLLQLPEKPICHMSWLAPPPYAPADEAKPAASAAATANAATIKSERRITLPSPGRIPLARVGSHPDGD